jgi:hypothetical protein
MNQDEIIEQVRAVRDELAARHGYDIRALYEAARQRSIRPKPHSTMGSVQWAP